MTQEEMGNILLDIHSKVNDHGKHFEKIERTLKDHDKQFEKINQTLKDHDKQFEKIDQTLKNHDKQFEKINQTLKNHDKQLKELDERSNKRYEKLCKDISKLNAKMNLMGAEITAKIDSANETMQKALERVDYLAGSVAVMERNHGERIQALMDIADDSTRKVESFENRMKRSEKEIAVHDVRIRMLLNPEAVESMKVLEL